MAPSLGYRKININCLTEVESIEQTFNSVMKKQGLLKEQVQPGQPVQPDQDPTDQGPVLLKLSSCS